MGDWHSTLATLISGQIPSGVELTTLEDAINGIAAAQVPYTPAWTNTATQPVLGNGTIQGYYSRIGKFGWLTIALSINTTTTLGTGTDMQFGLPAGWTAVTTTIGRSVGIACIRDQSGAVHTIGEAGLASGSSLQIRYHGGNVLTGAAPYALATGDFIRITGLVDLV